MLIFFDEFEFLSWQKICQQLIIELLHLGLILLLYATQSLRLSRLPHIQRWSLSQSGKNIIDEELIYILIDSFLRLSLCLFDGFLDFNGLVADYILLIFYLLVVLGNLLIFCVV